MDIPRIGHRKSEQPEETTNQQTGSTSNETSNAGIASEADSVESAADKSTFRFTDGWATQGSVESEHHAGLGGNEETQSLVIGFVDRTTERTGGGWVRMQYSTPANLGGKDVDVSLNVDAFLTAERKNGLAAEISIGYDTHVQLGVDMFGGAMGRLEGSAELGDVGEVHAGLEAGFAAGIVADVDMGLTDGVYHADIKLGLGIGIGAELDYGLSIDLGKAADMAWNIASDTASDVADWFSDIGEATSNFVEDAANSTGQATGDVVEDVAQAAEDTAEAVVDWVEQTVDW